MDRRATIREGLSALRHLRQLVRIGGVTPADFDRLTRKIESGLETGRDCEQLLPPPESVDFAETVARLAAAGLSVTTGAMLRDSTRQSVLDWSPPKGGTVELPTAADLAADFAAYRAEFVHLPDALPPCDASPTRMRTVGHLGVIEGDRK